jgi:hypothetical protein
MRKRKNIRGNEEHVIVATLDGMKKTIDSRPSVNEKVTKNTTLTAFALMSKTFSLSSSSAVETIID